MRRKKNKSLVSTLRKARGKWAQEKWTCKKDDSERERLPGATIKYSMLSLQGVLLCSHHMPCEFK
jgi:hypothetical protein